MNVLRTGIALSIVCVVLAIVFVNPFNANAQTTLVLQKGNTGANDPTQTGITSFDVKLGDTFAIDVWFNVGANDVTGIAAFLTFDEDVFEVIDQSLPTIGIQPFLMGASYSPLTAAQGNIYEEPNNIDGIQINAFASLSGQQTLNGSGRLARFQLRAIGTSPSSIVTIDDDRGTSRDTKMLFPNSTNNSFGILQGVIINVLGVNVKNIPDVLMEPGDVLPNHFDLDDFLIDAPDNTSSLIWSVSGLQDSVTVDINALTHQVTISADPGFTGLRDYIFKIRDPLGVEDTDTMNVGVTFKPEFTEKLPSVIDFNEDEVFISLLDTLARDLDDDSTTISWSGTSSNPDILLSIDNATRFATFQGTQDFNGNGIVRFIITDPKGAKDSTDVNVVILPVNDPPRISGLPDIHILPNEENTDIRLIEFTTDVEGNLAQTNFSWTGETKVKIVIDTDSRLTFSSIDPSFQGSETITFRAFENNPAFATFDAMVVTVGPKPPQIVQSLPDTSIISLNIQTTVPYVDLDDFVSDEDNPKGSLIWTTNDPSFVRANNPIHNAEFVVPPGTHEEKEIISTVTDPANDTVADTITVLVFNNGRPLIVDLPDVITIAVGSDTTLILDNHVKDDITSPTNMEWIATNNSSTTINISNTAPHIATISSVSPTFSGEETITFTVTDEENKIDSKDVLIRFVTPGVPIITGIPDIEITKNNSKSIDLDNFLTIFPESDRQNIQWSLSPTNNNVSVSINQNTNVVTFSVLNESFLSSVNFTFTATNTSNSQSTSDGMTVTVTFGKVPILGHLPDIVFVSGDTSDALELNKFVFDQDTEDDSLLWEVESINIIPIDGHLARGEDHILFMTSVPGYVGVERNVVISATDPEGNKVSDEIDVFVLSAANLELKVLPNPVSVDYIDAVVFATDTLIGTPSVTLDVNNEKFTLNIHKIGNELIWKADYVFSDNQTGKVTIVTEAADVFGGSIKDSTSFTRGVFSKVAGFTYTDNDINIFLPSEVNRNNESVIVIPDVRNKYYDWFTQKPANLNTKFAPLISYYVRSDVNVSSASEDGTLTFNIGSLTNSRTAQNKLGIYTVPVGSNEAEYVASTANKEKLHITARIRNFGLYFVAVDESPPILENIEALSTESYQFKVNVSDSESGIESFNTLLNGQIVTNQFHQLSDNEYIITFNSDDMIIDKSVLSVSAQDRAGNFSETFSLPLSVRNVTLPIAYELFQNYPNPFNPVTTIKYQIAQTNIVTLEIYNALGQKVRTLVSRQQTAGTHIVDWNGRNDQGQPVASGMYIYRLTTQNFTKIRKMILLK